MPTRWPGASANAGAIFIGAHTPEAIGDYVAGSNHVLPTARSARFSSGLGVLDFMKRTSILKCGPAQLRALAGAAIALGTAEGLDAHVRFDRHPAQPLARSRLGRSGVLYHLSAERDLFGTGRHPGSSPRAGFFRITPRWPARRAGMKPAASPR